MNLIELQQELRKMEAQLAGLSDEIENMKPQNAAADETEYERISRAAARHPIEIKELCQASDFQQSLYLKVLSYLINLDCSEPLPAVQHLSRIGAGLNSEKYTTAYLMQLGLQVTPQELAEVVSALELVSDYFLVDALLLLNLGQGLTAKSAALIAGWLGDWHYSAVDWQALAQIAKAFLTQDFDQLLDILVKDPQHWQGKFGHYISREWIEKGLTQKMGEDFPEDKRKILANKAAAALKADGVFAKFSKWERERECNFLYDNKEYSKKWAELIIVVVLAGFSVKFTIDEYRDAVQKYFSNHLSDVVNTVYELNGYFYSYYTMEETLNYILREYTEACKRAIEAVTVEESVREFFGIISRKVQDKIGRECRYNLS